MDLHKERAESARVHATLLFITCTTTCIVTITVWLVATPTIHASPDFEGYLQSALARYPNINGTALGNCLLCHVSNNRPSPGVRNPYGTAFAAANHNFQAIEGLDSDGDGSSNLVEINALTFPGDRNSQPPTPTSTATATATPTPTNTATATATPTNTSTATATATPTSSGTATATATATNTSAAIVTATPTNTAVALPTNTSVPTFTATPIATATSTHTPTATALPDAASPGLFLPTLFNNFIPLYCEEILTKSKIWQGQLTSECDTATTKIDLMALKLSADTFSIVEQYSPLLRVQPNHTYQVSYWVKTDLITDGAEIYGRVIAAQYDQHAQEGDDVNVNRLDPGFSLGESVGGQTDWVFQSYTFVTLSDTVYVRLRGVLGGPVGTAQGTIWFDQISFQP